MKISTLEERKIALEKNMKNLESQVQTLHQTRQQKENELVELKQKFDATGKSYGA